MSSFPVNRNIPAALRPRSPTTPTPCSSDDEPQAEAAVPFAALRLLSRRQAAQVLSISMRTIDHLVTAGELQSVRIGDRRLFRPADLDAFVAALK